MKKRFQNTNSEFLEIPRFRFFSGILLGLLYAFTFYGFLYLSREALRIIAVTEDFDLCIISDEAVNFYNLFFAFIAVIFSQSVCIIFWFDRPKKIFGKRNYRKNLIVNDQRVLNWYFLSWFSKLAFVFGIFLTVSNYVNYNEINFNHEYKYVLIPIIIVLFFQTWNSIRLNFRQHSFKWMLLSMVIVSVISFGLSKVNLIDYNAINQGYLDKNINYKYQVELPETNYYKRPFRHIMNNDFYLVRSLNPNEKQPIIFYDNTELSLNQLRITIGDLLSKIDDYDRYSKVFQLHIDKNIQMKFVNQFKKELSNAGISKIAYLVVPTNAKKELTLYKDYVFFHRLPPAPDFLNLNEDLDRNLDFHNIIDIQQAENCVYLINEKPVENNKIKAILKDLFQDEPIYKIKFHVNENMTFDDYLMIISITEEAVSELRNAYAKEVYFKSLEHLDDDQVNEVLKKFTLNLIEIPAINESFLP